MCTSKNLILQTQALVQFRKLVLQSKGPPYIGYTTRHLHQRYRTSAAGRHKKGCHGVTNLKLAIIQVLRFVEMPGETGLLNLRNASHPDEENQT